MSRELPHLLDHLNLSEMDLSKIPSNIAKSINNFRTDRIRRGRRIKLKCKTHINSPLSFIFSQFSELQKEISTFGESIKKMMPPDVLIF